MSKFRRIQIGQHISITCENCDATVSAEVLHSYTALKSEEDNAFMSWWQDNELKSEEDNIEYFFLKCGKCSVPIVAAQDVYPFSDVSILSQRNQLDSSVPETLRRTYNQALTCYNAGAFDAVATMCRKAIEGICKTHGIAERGLAKALRKMRDSGAIEPHFYEWAENLKIAGDRAVHEDQANVSREDAKDIIDLTGALLAYLFTYKHRFDAYMNRTVGTAFEITDLSLEKLRQEKLPDDVLKKLKPIKDNVMMREKFLEALKETIGHADTEKFKSKILECAHWLPVISVNGIIDT